MLLSHFICRRQKPFQQVGATDYLIYNRDSCTISTHSIYTIYSKGADMHGIHSFCARIYHICTDLVIREAYVDDQQIDIAGLKRQTS